MITFKLIKKTLKLLEIPNDQTFAQDHFAFWSRAQSFCKLCDAQKLHIHSEQTGAKDTDAQKTEIPRGSLTRDTLKEYLAFLNPGDICP